MVLRVIYSFLSVALLGGLLGIGLAYASRVFAVKKDERIEKVEAALPGANCGACGFAGCAAYAEAVVNEGADINLCAPGGASAVKDIAEIMGIDADVGEGERMVAQVHCRGSKATSSYLYEYRGVIDCNAAHMLFEGDKECKFGCLGMGSCMKVCPTDAIYYDSEGLVRVDREKCIGCEQCVDVCPTGVMKMIPYSADYIVACNSTDKGAKVRKYCKVGCIGCKICEKKAPEGGFKVENFLASIDYSQTGERIPAAEACPTKCIILADDSLIETVSVDEKGAENGKKEDKKVVNEKA